MTPLEPSQRESVLRRLAFIEQELADLDAYPQLDRRRFEIDRAALRNLERIFENIANAAIDIA